MQGMLNCSLPNTVNRFCFPRFPSNPYSMLHKTRRILLRIARHFSRGFLEMLPGHEYIQHTSYMYLTALHIHSSCLLSAILPYLHYHHLRTTCAGCWN